MIIKKSEKRVSNPRPQPWEGCALPTELFSLIVLCCKGTNYFSNSLLLIPKISHTTVLKCVKKIAILLQRKA